MTLDEFRALPEAIFLVRHAESMGNADMETYASTPDYEVPLSAVGWGQAVEAGRGLRDGLERRHGPDGYRCFFYVSPYCRTRQTFVAIREAFEERAFAGLDEDINLREQEFSGGLQTDRIRKDLEDRLRYGRFFFRFPSGESTADGEFVVITTEVGACVALVFVELGGAAPAREKAASAAAPEF
jgi:broad specificity phosphatase PhoE